MSLFDQIGVEEVIVISKILLNFQFEIFPIKYE
jgi:hypothetical protein